jgi:hypothetical protein
MMALISLGEIRQGKNVRLQRRRQGSGRRGIVNMMLTWLIISLVCGQSGANPILNAKKFTSFLSSLEGPGVGRAVKTPVGPRPYDITFQHTIVNQLEGQAHPGKATHFWTFFLEGQTPRLRFLTTFAGNRRPIYLTATTELAGEWIFNTADPEYVEVHVKLRENDLTIRILLRGEFHVQIKLNRPQNYNSDLKGK